MTDAWFRDLGAAIQANNDSVNLLSTAEYDSAVEALTKAFKDSNQCFSLKRKIGTRGCLHNAFCDAPSLLEKCVISLRPLSQCSSSIDNDSSVNEPRIYREFIQIPIRHHEREDLVHYRDSELTVSVVLVFNLALVSHIQSLEGKTAQKRCTSLIQACKLYRLGIKLLTHGFCNQGNSNNSMYLMMMTMYNLGIALNHLGNEKGARKIFEKIVTTLMFAEKCIKEEAFDCLYSNISRFVWSRSTAPAA